MEENEYKVQIAQFEGPLDLLLHLIGKARIDIEEIFVSKVTGQYLEYVAAMPRLSMESASEFLEMAALLVYIKSRMLLPDENDGEEDEDDPEQELIARLKVYKQFKEAAEAMKVLEADATGTYYKLPDEVVFPDAKIVLDEMSLSELCAAYGEVQARVPDAEIERVEEVEIHHDIFTIKGRTKHILRSLGRISNASFSSLFSEVRSKMEVAVTFIALLELIHENIVRITQNECYDDIYISRISEEAAG